MTEQTFLKASPRVGVGMKTQFHDDKIRSLGKCGILRKETRQVGWKKRNLRLLSPHSILPIVGPLLAPDSVDLFPSDPHP